MGIHTYFRNDVSWAGDTGIFLELLRDFFKNFPHEVRGSCCILSNGKTVKLHLAVQDGRESLGFSASAPSLEDLLHNLKKNVQPYLNSQRIGK